MREAVFKRMSSSVWARVWEVGRWHHGGGIMLERVDRLGCVLCLLHTHTRPHDHLYMYVMTHMCCLHAMLMSVMGEVDISTTNNNEGRGGLREGIVYLNAGRGG